MTDVRWNRLDALFAQAADLPPDRQQALVLDACGDDVELRAMALALLARDRARGDRLATVIEAAARLPVSEAASAPGDGDAFAATRCGPYRIVREIGRGGMGIVFEAVRDDGAFTKRVALKVAMRAAWSREFQRRFQDERQILARLEHPHIARLLDGGTTSDGVPYFAMELIDGVPIHEHVTRTQASLPERLRLFLQVCDAVDYAHQNLVIHRDLTPRNILVVNGAVRLLDFGISKLLDAADRGADDPQATVGGLVPFTPAYGSPEQLHGDLVTTRTDVYALGLVLFELLTGTRAQRVEGTSPAALERAICETPIPAPSAAARTPRDRAWARRLRGDLDTIVLTAAERDPARRYPSVAALAEDVRRHLASKPVQARQAGAWYRGRRFARRHWRPLTAAALLVGTLTAGIVSTRAQTARAERRFEEVRRIANTLMGDVHAAIRDLPASTKAQEVVVATAVQYLEGLAREAADDRALLTEVGQGYTKVAELAFARWRPSLGRPDAARRYLDRAEALLAPLHAAHPDDARVATAMTRLQLARGSFLDDSGRRLEALAGIERAIATGESALARHGADEALLAAVLEAYGSLLARFDASPSAMRHAARYLERAEQLARRPAPTVETRAALGTAYSQAGKVAAANGREEEALRYFRRTADLQADIVAAEPFNATARRNLMLAWSNLADMALGPLGLNSYSGAGGPAAPLDPRRRQQAFEAAAQAIAQAEWKARQDPRDTAAMLDRAVALGRSAPTYPPGESGAIAALEQALALLAALEASYPDRTRHFLLEFHGSLAERHRQTGRLDRAAAAWQAADAAYRRAVAAAPEVYYPRRLLIPILQNQAMTLAGAGDVAGARRAADRAVALADDVGTRAAQYARAPGWPPRVRDWQADLHGSLGDRAAAARVRAESRALWTAIAARTDLPSDLTAEAAAALTRP